MRTQLLPLIAAEPVPARTAAEPTCGELKSADGRLLPLKACSVDTVVVGMTATSTVRQLFANTGDSTIEATYVFPLPPRAGVTDFVADMAGRRVVGVLKERGQARTDYEQAVADGQRAAIVEEDRSDVFSVRVGNLGPGEQATVEMRLTGPLEFQDGEATFRFPLVVAPRYTTGSPLLGDQTGSGVACDTAAVPDASRVTPPRLEDVDDRPDLQISLSLHDGGLPVSDLRASLATAVLDSSPEGLTRLRVEPGARADRDFVLRFRLDRSEWSSSALLVPDAERDSADGEGTWSVTLVPPAETSTAPRDVVVVLDRSGSMGGWKMVAARRAAGRIVDMLDTVDRFCVLAFDHQIDTPAAMPAGLVEGSDRNRFAAASWLGTLTSRGGTEMAAPLRTAVEMLTASGEDRQASVVLVTDGQITGEDHLLATLAPAIGRTHVYCVGIDRAVNAGFLDRLARLGTGRAELVDSEDRLDEAMARLARTIGRPSLTAVRVTPDAMAGVECIDGTVTPSLSPDAFAGVPCVISGRYRGPATSVTLHVEADAANGPFATALPARVVPEAIAVRTIWARSVVRDLEDEYASWRSSDASDDLAARLIAHSIRFGVLSRFTAFVAIDPDRPESSEAGPLTEIVQPVEAPSGWAAPRLMAAAAPMAARAMTPPPSAAAVPAAKRVRKRSLADLLKRVRQAVPKDDSGLDDVWAELTVHRDTSADPDLRSALTKLCDALNRYLCNPTEKQARTVMEALDEVQRVLATAKRRRRVRRPRFWV
ncbi:VIT domain-containing protein [Mycobacterium spongiae]|uniref:VWA domain-containing protein n=1 Tax=Mycobacterium spongiae TaxID=886343 RepID=A0A975JVR5_9MYCO|nr:VIT domain-containing protein [Mycobacterium spongiae]QUR66556.1 VWA domain-containing protein [Mycobacterium spongiae]